MPGGAGRRGDPPASRARALGNAAALQPGTGEMDGAGLNTKDSEWVSPRAPDRGTQELPGPPGAHSTTPMVNKKTGIRRAKLKRTISPSWNDQLPAPPWTCPQGRATAGDSADSSPMESLHRLKGSHLSRGEEEPTALPYVQDEEALRHGHSDGQGGTRREEPFRLPLSFVKQSTQRRAAKMHTVCGLSCAHC